MRNDTKTEGLKLYGIGIGPGSPDLLTLRGLNILETIARNRGTVFTPAGKLSDGSLAREIIERHDIDVSSWRELEFPMTTDKLDLEAKWKKAAEVVIAEMEKTGTAAFLTLGDPSVYSTWIYLRREIELAAPDFECVTVPGVQTMNAAAAAVNIPLLEGKERLALVPTPDDPGELDPIISLFDTVVLYKVGKRFPKVRKYLTAKGLDRSSCYAERLGHESQIITKGMESLPDSASGYLSTIIIKTGGLQ